MVKLRLKRVGKKKSAFYRIVAIDSRAKRDGEYIELIGTYNPINGEKNIKSDVALKWLTDGAQPTDTVRSLFSKEGILKEFHENKFGKKLKSTDGKKPPKPPKPAKQDEKKPPKPPKPDKHDEKHDDKKPPKPDKHDDKKPPKPKPQKAS